MPATRAHHGRFHSIAPTSARDVLQEIDERHRQRLQEVEERRGQRNVRSIAPIAEENEEIIQTNSTRVVIPQSSTNNFNSAEFPPLRRNSDNRSQQQTTDASAFDNLTTSINPHSYSSIIDFHRSRNAPDTEQRSEEISQNRQWRQQRFPNQSSRYAVVNEMLQSLDERHRQRTAFLSQTAQERNEALTPPESQTTTSRFANVNEILQRIDERQNQRINFASRRVFQSPAPTAPLANELLDLPPPFIDATRNDSNISSLINRSMKVIEELPPSYEEAIRKMKTEEAQEAF